MSGVTYSPLGLQMPPGSWARILAQNSVSGRGWGWAMAVVMPIPPMAKAAIKILVTVFMGVVYRVFAVLAMNGSGFVLALGGG